MQLGQNSRSAAGPVRETAQRTGARARARFKPDGRGPGVSEMRGRWRGEADRRGPPVIPNPESRRPASSPATMQGTARSGEGTAGLSVM